MPHFIVLAFSLWHPPGSRDPKLGDLHGSAEMWLDSSSWAGHGHMVLLGLGGEAEMHAGGRANERGKALGGVQERSCRQMSRPGPGSFSPH